MDRNEEDAAWKEILDLYLKDFIELCFPMLSELINWNKKWMSLDKELQTITRSNVSRKQLLDKLYQVNLKDGSEQWILIHIEIQGKKEKLFPERMFTYAYRSFDKYKKPIISLAVLTDKNNKWRPNSFKVGLGGSYLKLKFLVIKIIDYQDKMTELNSSTNPFASVLLVQLAAIEIKKAQAGYRKQIKLSLIKRLYTLGLSKEEVYNLFRFIDWLIGLPKHLEIKCLDEVHQFEKEKKMAYVSSLEKYGMEVGIEIGIKQGLEKGVEKGLEQGLKQGLKQGLEQGLEQGLQQGIKKGLNNGIEQKARDVAIRMLNKGFSLDVIAEVTCLSKEEVKTLQPELTA
jgi:hypothetical protein